MLDVCMLGTGGSLPLPSRALSACYVRVRGRGLLIDCGEGTQNGIRTLGWGFRCIDGMLLTHYHGDHCGGLPGFLLSLGKAERREPFHIWGGAGLKHIVDGLRVIAPVLPYPVELHEFEGDGAELELIGLNIRAFRLEHGVPCYGYRLDLPRSAEFLPDKARALGVPVALWHDLQAGSDVCVDGRVVRAEEVYGAARRGLRMVYATDTRPVESIVTEGHGADLMVLEGMYGDEGKRAQALANHHMLFAEAAELAKRAEAKRLLLTHFSTCIEDPGEYLPLARAIFPEAEAAQDGMQLTLTYPNENPPRER